MHGAHVPLLTFDALCVLLHREHWPANVHGDVFFGINVRMCLNAIILCSFIAKFIESCCMRRPHLLPSGTETLLSLSVSAEALASQIFFDFVFSLLFPSQSDADLSVVKAVIKCVGLRKSFVLEYPTHADNPCMHFN